MGKMGELRRASIEGNHGSVAVQVGLYGKIFMSMMTATMNQITPLHQQLPSKWRMIGMGRNS